MVRKRKEVVAASDDEAGEVRTGPVRGESRSRDERDRGDGLLFLDKR